MLSKLFLTLCLISCLFPPFAFAQQWLANGPAEYASRCAPGTKASGEYVCFTYNFDITMTAIGGVYQGYANADGTGFALVPRGDGAGESLSLTTIDCQVDIAWGGDGKAHVTIHKDMGAGLSNDQVMDVQNPDRSHTFAL